MVLQMAMKWEELRVQMLEKHAEEEEVWKERMERQAGANHVLGICFKSREKPLL